MNEILLGCLVVVLLNGLICVYLSYLLRMMFKKQINYHKNQINDYEEIGKMRIDRIRNDILITQAEISDIKSMVDELSRHNSDIADVVDRAAKQYQDEISSLFSYCGENRSNE